MQVTNRINLTTYEGAKQSVIEARKNELTPLLGTTVRVYDSRSDVIGFLRYDSKSEKYFVTLSELVQNSILHVSRIVFYPTEVEIVTNNIIRLCEI